MIISTLNSLHVENYFLYEFRNGHLIKSGSKNNWQISFGVTYKKFTTVSNR